MKVLVAEDDELTREGLMEILRREGYTPVGAVDGEDAMRLYQQEQPDFVCLDIMMPGLSGFEVCRKLRERDPLLPIIFISAKSEEIDKVVGLELGADDFIMKPFGVSEVVARIRAVTRRYNLARKQPESDAPFLMGELEVIPLELRARRDKEAFDLSLRDVCILRTLYLNRGNVVDRNALFDACWGHHYLPSSRSLDQHVSQLRKRIERDPKVPAIIQTVHGHGYRFE
jgi:DNA-binding response OmpR family regulator